MSDRLGRAARWARQGLLTVGAALGVVCILMTLGAALFGLRPLVFESGSMSPTIRTGDLAISHDVDAASLRQGDVVSVPTGTGSRVTHRIVSVSHEGGDAVLRLRGDANSATDATPYRVSHADRVLFHLPRLGYVVGWISSPFGLFLLGLYAAFLLSVVVKGSPREGSGTGSGSGDGVQAEPLSSEVRLVVPSPAARRRWSRGIRRPDRRLMVSGGLSVLLALGAVSGVAVARATTPTTAAWTDAGPVSGTRLSAYTVPAPPSGATCAALPAGSGNLQGVVYTWATPTTSVAYTATVTPTLSGSSSVFASSGGNTTLTVTYDAPKSDKGVTVSVAAQAYPPGTTTWLSQPTTLRSFKTGPQPSSAPTCQ